MERGRPVSKIESGRLFLPCAQIQSITCMASDIRAASWVNLPCRSPYAMHHPALTAT